VALIVLGNLFDLAIGGDVLAVSWLAGAKAAATLLLVVAAARWCGVTLAEMGIRRQNLLRASLVGAGFALLVASVSLAALRLGPFVGGRVTYAPLRGEAVPPLLFHALIALPLQTAVPEELAFRGLLLGLFMRNLSPRRAAVGMSALFVAWHIVVQAQTLAQTNLNTVLLIIPAAVVAVLALFVGGLLFAYLRLRTHNLAAAVAAHWGFNAALVLGLYVLART
jgi:tRNA pseudouridine32 synthase/23S rRNA pseudouridine746 synthase